jgi:hypothetical protein
MDMRAIVCSVIVALFPMLASAETVEYTFSGAIDNEVTAGPPNLWNGPGPQPSTFQMTFDVDTLSPMNSFSYTFGPSSGGSSINAISVDVAVTNVSFSFDGTTVLQSSQGSFAFSGTSLGEFTLTGGFGLAATDGAGFLFVPDFGLGVTTQAALMGSNDPLGLLLSGSQFNADSGNPSYLTFDDSQLGAVISGVGIATSVPEPTTLALLVIAGIGLGFVHRHRLDSTLSAKSRRRISVAATTQKLERRVSRPRCANVAADRIGRY